MSVDVTSSSFETDVVAASSGIPVLVDFWAPWCQPCVALDPVLKELETEAAGAWRLAKVDTEAEPALAARFAITAIPALKVFVDGAIAGETFGAPTREALRQWIARFLPGPEKEHLEQARAALAADDLQEARRLFELAHREKPTLTEAVTGLATVLVRLGETEEAARWVRDLTGPDAARVRLALAAAAGPGLEAAAKEAETHRDAARLLALGVAEAAAGHHAEALEALVGSVQADRKHADEAARRAMLDVFEVVGSDSELVDEYRRKLAMALY